MTSPIVTLAQCGIAPIVGKSTAINGSEGDTGHYGGDPLGGFPWDHSRCPSIWRAWDAFHRSKGWAGVAYNYGVCHHQFIFEGRGAGFRSAAQGTNAGNATSYAVVAMIGAGEPLTDAHKLAWLDARALLMAGPRPASAKIHTHDDWHSTSCPGDPLRAWIKAGAPSPIAAWTPPAPAHMSEPCTAFARTPSGQGYILVDAKGGVFTFGDAMFFGSLPGIGVVPNKPIVAAAISPSGGGYALVGADGGVFAFGDFRYSGGLGAVALNKPVSDFDVTPSGAGYWMAAEDAGVFAFGDAPYLGSAA